MFERIVFLVFSSGFLVLIAMMLIRVFRGPGIYDRLNGIFVIGTDIIILLLLVGFADGRLDMYVDIALSYAILGFVSTIVVARFIGRKDKEQ
jgi:multicomponent Na+:H+ antiporter subunit F